MGMLLKKQVWGGRSPGHSELPMSAFHSQTVKEGSAPAGRPGDWLWVLRWGMEAGGSLGRDVDACPPMTPLSTERLTQEEAPCCRLPAAL